MDEEYDNLKSLLVVIADQSILDQVLKLHLLLLKPAPPMHTRYDGIKGLAGNFACCPSLALAS
jgi:hypothetical protein